MQTTDLMDDLTGLTDRAALEQYGINVVDVRIKRLNLPEQNKQSVYARMRAERERIARQYRAEGEEQALSIRADADRQKAEILSVAYKEAEKIRGEGDAESTRIYGQAYSKNPRFYKLLRTLEAYKKVLDDKTTAMLSSDSELLKVLTRGEAGARSALHACSRSGIAGRAGRPSAGCAVPWWRDRRDCAWDRCSLWVLSGVFLVQTGPAGGGDAVRRGRGSARPARDFIMRCHGPSTASPS